jgi:predicted  nucleic acid-binding Zn-ribbon protein
MALALKSDEVEALHREIERLQERISVLNSELSTEEERAEQAEERAEDIAREMEALVPQSDLIRAWAERRRVLGLTLDVEELARDVECESWEFGK